MIRNDHEKPRSISPSHLAIAAVLLFAALLLVDVALAAVPCQSGVIAVKETPIRKGPQAFAPKAGVTLRMGDKVKSNATRGAFCRVTIKGVTGWVAASAFASDAQAAIYRAEKGAKINVSQREAAAAGKGFNEKYEDTYKSKHAEADFASVDRLQGMIISEQDLLRFRRAGALSLQGGQQ